MTIQFAIQSIIILGILYVGFSIFFRKTRRFNLLRGLLLFSILSPIIIPLIQMTMPRITHIPQRLFPIDIINNGVTIIREVSQQTHTITQHTIQGIDLTTIYLIITAILLIRFMLNLFTILIFTIKAQRKEQEGFHFVFDHSSIIPRSFFRYIYVNQRDFQTGHLDESIILHEKGHAEQLHSLDILLVEILQVFMWYNPFIYLFKQLIKNNHEFLVDEYVANRKICKKKYSNQLIDITFRKTPKFTSGFSQHLIKRRLTMLSKHDQKKGITFQTPLYFLLVLIVFAGVAAKKTSDIQLLLKPNASCVVNFQDNTSNSELIIQSQPGITFNYLNGRYLVAKNMIRFQVSSDNKNIIFEMENYTFHEKDGEVFVDGIKIGNVEKSDFLILYPHSKIEVYNKDRVKILK